MLEEIQSYHSRKKININQLEQSIKEMNINYYDNGGYDSFYQSIMQLQHESVIKQSKQMVCFPHYQNTSG